MANQYQVRKQVLASELVKLAERNPDRIVQAQDVVEEARNEQSPLHRFFDWDDTKAAEQWRLQQARQLMTTIALVRQEEGRKLKIPTWTSLPEDRKHPGGGYRLMEDVMASDSLRQHLLETVLRELTGIEAKYQHLQEFGPVWGAVSEVESELGLDAGKTLDEDEEPTNTSKRSFLR